MAEYELPPLRIKIVGDGKSFQKTVDASVKAAKDGAEDIAKVQKASAKSEKATQRDVERETKRHWNRLVKSAQDGYRNMGRLTSFGRATVSTARANRDKRQGAASPFARLVANAEKEVKAQAKDRKAAEKRAWRELADGVRGASMHVEQRQNLSAGISKLFAAKDNSKAAASQLEAIHQVAYLANKRIESSQAKQITNARKIAKEQEAASRGSEQTARVRARARSSRGNSFGMLTDRADIYMHIAAIQQLASAWRSPLKALTDYQTSLASMTPLLGGEANARAFLDQQSRSMTGMMYGPEAMTGAVRFLGAGQSMEQTQRMLDNIGNIAGGSAERFQGLARAFSQVASLGRLQGDELEQLSEHNFPLLQYMSELTGKKTGELREMMKKGQITYAAVAATLNALTAKGGKLAGVMEDMARKLPGATMRVKALYTELQRRVMETASEELAKYVIMLGQVLEKTIDWVRKNPEATKEWVMFALRLSAVVVLMNALSLVMSVVHWQYLAMAKIVKLLTTTYNALKWAITGFLSVVYGIPKAIVAVRLALAALRVQLLFTAAAATAAWIASLGPIGIGTAVAAAVMAVAAAFSVLAWSIIDPEGFTGAINYVWSYISGFFTWLGEVMWEMGSMLGATLGDALKSAFKSSEEWLKSMGIDGLIKDGSLTPDQDGTDINSLFGPGKGSKIRNGEHSPAISVRDTMEHADRWAKYRMATQGVEEPDKDKKLEEAKKTNKLLEKISKSLGGPAEAGIAMANLVEAM